MSSVTSEARPATTRRPAVLRHPRWLAPAVAAALVVAGLVVSLLRVPWAHHDVVWAEDGHIFLYQLLQSGPLASLFHGYAGYQHLVPRLGAMIVTGLLPLDQYAVGVFVLCSILTGLVAAAVFWLSRDLVPWFWARVALGLVTILLPLSSQEVLGNLADIHSYCMWLAPWLLLYRPRTWVSSALWAFVMLLCAMTEVQILLFVALIPFCLTKAYRKTLPIIGAMLVGVGAQVLTTITEPRPRTAQWLGIPSIVEGWLVNTVMPLVFPQPATERAILAHWGMLVPLVILIPFAAAAIVGLVLGTWRQRLLMLTLLLASAAVYSAGAVADGSYPFRYALYTAKMWETGYVNIRYGVSSGLFLAATIPVAAGILYCRRWRRRPARVAARSLAAVGLIGLVATMGIACTDTYSDRHVPAGFGSWSASVDAAAAACRSASPSTAAPLPVAPDRVLTMACSTVLAHAR